MTLLAEPATIATVIFPAEPASTEQLLRRRHDLPAGHPDRVGLRARVIEDNLPMAGRLARRYSGRGELLDDLAQVAALALIKAVDSYDPDREVPFTGYAVPCIRGALKRHFRDTARGMRVPRSTQELAHDAATATDELSQQRNRTPTRAELAAHLHVNADDLQAAVGSSHAYHLESLNAPDSRTGDLTDLIGGPDPRYDTVDDRLSLQPFVTALPLRQRHIIVLRFYGHLSQARIAAEVGVSQMHVSRLLSQSLAQLRAAMTD